MSEPEGLPVALPAELFYFDMFDWVEAHGGWGAFRLDVADFLGLTDG